MNLYGFAGGDPVNFADPFGLAPCEKGDWLCTTANAAAGFGDAVTFGLTDKIRGAIDANGVIDKDGGAYLTGEIGGFAASAALGSATASAIREGSILATSGLARTAATSALDSPVGQALFGKGGALNTGRELRIGTGKNLGRAVFRAAGEQVEAWTGAKHVDLIDLGKLDDFLQAIGKKP